jgi:hypothetical protein
MVKGKPSKTGGGVGTNGYQRKGKSKYAGANEHADLLKIPDDIFTTAYNNQHPTERDVDVNYTSSIDRQIAELEKTASFEAVEKLLEKKYAAEAKTEEVYEFYHAAEPLSTYGKRKMKADTKRAENELIKANQKFEEGKRKSFMLHLLQEAKKEKNPAKQGAMIAPLSDDKEVLKDIIEKTDPLEEKAPKGVYVLGWVLENKNTDAEVRKLARQKIATWANNYIDKDPDKLFSTANKLSEHPENSNEAAKHISELLDKEQFPEHMENAIADYYAEKFDWTRIKSDVYDKYVNHVTDFLVPKTERP